MPIRLLQDMECSGKTVVIRQDLNVPMKDGRITNDKRIRAALPGIRMALDKGAGVVLLSHLGRPTEGVVEEKFSLAPVAAHLSGLLDNLLGKVDTLIVGGGIANTFLAAAGYSVGTSLYEPELVDDAKKVMAKAKELGKTLPLPVDVVTAKELAPGQTATVCDVDKVPADEMILDVGPKTVELYAGLLQKAATVVWNGPVGAFETDPFGAGTKALAEALAASPAFVVVGGGDSVAAVESYGLADKMGYISTGGGASLELLEGKLLPSVAALQDRGE